MQMKEWLVGSGRDYIRVGAMLRRSSALDGKVVQYKIIDFPITNAFALW